MLDFNKKTAGSDVGSEQHSSEEEEEDDEGELINAKVEKKFLETIAMIRANDPKLKETQGEVFQDTDFEEADGGVTKKQNDKKLTYKDQIREDVLKREKKGESDA